MGRIKNGRFRTKWGMKKDMLQEAEQQLRWYGRIARRVAEWNPQGRRRREKQ
jgi:hypothetical protein